MNIFFKFVFIFFIGSTLGWVLELLFRRIVHGKWINPGFLVGPYLPIYGFGLTALTEIYYLFRNLNINPIIIILLMGIAMTIIELIGGLMMLKDNIRLWDYSDLPFNYKGVICLLFSIIWTIGGAVYYYFIAPYIENALIWFSNNLLFSFVLGIFTGIIMLDYIYSTKLIKRIKKYAKENDIIIKYERLKMSIKEMQLEAEEKYSFLFPFKQTKALKEYLSDYNDKNKKG